MNDTVVLLDNYIAIAYEVNILNSTINMLRNCSYSKYISVACDVMVEELGEKIEESHEASRMFLSAVYLLDDAKKASLAVMLLEKSAQCQKMIEELMYRLSELQAKIRNNQGVAPDILEGVIPLASPKRTAKRNEDETKYIEVFKEIERFEFANNIYTNYAAYLGYTRNQGKKK